MAPAIAHFLVGASLFLVVAAPLVRRYDLAWPWPLWLVAIGGVWGLLPDAHHVAPVLEARLYALHGSAWTDLFAFHHALDRPAVRARHVESVFASILCFLGAVGALTLAGVATEPGGRGPEAAAPAASLFALLAGIALGGLGYAALG